MSEPTAESAAARPERSSRWDDWRRRVTSGALRGTNGGGKQLLLRLFAVIFAFTFLSDAVSSLSIVHYSARIGRELPTWQPITWEFTSGLAELPACLVVLAAIRLIPWRRSQWPQAALMHWAASIAFSAVHVGGMVLLRSLVYLAASAHYSMPLADLPYEYCNDLVSYMIIAWVLSSARSSPRQAGKAEPSRATANPSPFFDIVDGGRILRTPVGEIVSVRAAGNYVEFVLENHKRPLMRASLQEAPSALEPAGFVRTHRSWIVNKARVRSLTPVGSGDFRVTLDTGGEAPISRRFPEALARLRSPS